MKKSASMKMKNTKKATTASKKKTVFQSGPVAAGERAINKMMNFFGGEE